MKKLLIFAIAIAVLYICMSSCDSNMDKKQIPTLRYEGGNFVILEIDSCEYVMYDKAIYSLTHKGNCKYCAERQKKMIESTLNKK